MQVIHERCCGLDVHKKTVVACAVTPDGQQVRSFGTTTRELRALADWLAAREVTHVAMESTGVFWKPVYNVLEQRGLTLLVVNAQQIKALPGRKTDIQDAAWIADLLRHGLVRGSYIPDRAQREQQELVRYRTRLLQERGQVVQRIQKALEGANIKLSGSWGISSGYRAGQCSTRSWPAQPIRKRWRRWPAGGCGRSARR